MAGKRQRNESWKHIYGKDRKYTARVDRLQDRAWEHPYETKQGDICIHCGQIGSYIHTDPAAR